MAYAEKRGNLWRARWRGPDGTLESKPGFRSRKDAEKYGRDQDAAIRNNTYVDPRAGQITVTEWVNDWYPALDLELTTLANYRYAIEVHILPKFGDRALASLNAQEISTWEIQIARRGYARRTARDARTTLTTLLGDAIPRYIQVNPAQRKRGKGRPKDGSIRPADLPPFLAELLGWHLSSARKCTCRNTEPPWCPGAEYVFLNSGGSHFSRSGYGERYFRP